MADYPLQRDHRLKAAYDICRLILSLACLMSVAGAAADDGWRNLRRMRRDREYTVLMQNGPCVTGRVTGADNSALKLSPRPESGNQRTPKSDIRTIVVVRNNVLRVTDNPFGDPHDTIYSGRSSWIDVKASRPKEKAEWLKVLDKRGNERTCKAPQASDDALKCGTEEISKWEIARVYSSGLSPLQTG
jgi:hypothetical protein